MGTAGRSGGGTPDMDEWAAFGGRKGVTAMEAANVALRFVLELIGVGFAGYWGYQQANGAQLRLIFAVVSAVVVVAIWGAFIAPTAASPLTRAQKNVVGTVVLLVTAVGMAVVGQPTVALVFGIAVLLNLALLFVLGDDLGTGLGSAGDPN
jgi:hypothetical protein